jgi:hypothetical protein
VQEELDISLRTEKRRRHATGNLGTARLEGARDVA